MKKNTIILIIAILLIFIIIFSAIVYASSNKQDATIEEKVSQEIKYLNGYIVSLLGQYNGLNIGNSDFHTSNEENSKDDKQSSEEESNTNSLTGQNNTILITDQKYNPKWKTIKIQLEELYRTWNTINLDLYAVNIDASSVLSFTDVLNSATQNAQKEDKQKSMEQVNNLYKLLPQYTRSYLPNDQKTQLLEMQAKVVSSYVNVTNENWDEAGNLLTQAEQQFSNLINTIMKEQNNQSTMNQAYILVNELRRAVNIKDKDIFFIQYQNFIEKMEMLI